MILPDGTLKLRGPGNKTLFKRKVIVERDDFVVRDMRRDFFMVDNLFMDVYARKCGPYATGVYFALCRHANHDQMCFPSHTLIAEKLAISRRQVMRAIELLEYYNIVRTKRFMGEPNQYLLAGTSCWKPADDERISKSLTALWKRNGRKAATM